MTEKRLSWFLLALLPAASLAAAPGASAPFPSKESISVRDVFQIARPSADHASLEVVASGVRRLESLEEKISVVAIVGGYHSGKSFMLNALNESFGTRDFGFEMTDSHEPTTRGLWLGLTDMTSEVDGSRVALLDTEGFSSAGVAESYDAQIFSVAALLASHLVYNSRTLITAAEVEYLETLARRAHLWSLTTRVGGESTKTAGTETPGLAAFPPLTWAVQDFGWDLRGADPTSWLASFMGGAGDDRKVNTPKSTPIGRRPLVDGNYTLRELFRGDVRARVFAPPATARASPASLRDAPVDFLDPLFLAATRAFRGELLRSAASRRSAVDAAQDAGTRGASLAARLRTLVDAARDGSLPELPSLWSSAWESRLVAAAAAAALAARDAAARAALAASPPLAPCAFEAALAGARADAERLFKTHLFGLERLWRGPLRETHGAMARRDAKDAEANDAAVTATLRLAADDAKDTAARGIAAVARPVPPAAFRREMDEVLGLIDAAFREKTRAYMRCAATRGAAREVAREVARARDGAAAAAERDNAARGAATLAAAVAAGTRAYDLEMTASTLSSAGSVPEEPGLEPGTRVKGEDASSIPRASTKPNAKPRDEALGDEIVTALGTPLRASAVAALDAMTRDLARRAFRAEAAGAAWMLETRDGVASAKALEDALERRGEHWRRRNARLAAAAAEAVREDVVAFAEAETDAFARRLSLREALLNETEALVAKSLETFDLWTSGFEDVPERADARVSLAGTLGNLAAAARAGNAAAWAEALAPVGAAARDRLEAEPTCFRGFRGAITAVTGDGLASRRLASLASLLRACARDAAPSALERRAADAWLAAFEDARDAGTPQPFFGKRTFLSSAATSTDAAAARKAGEMSPEALREVARAFAATDAFVASLRARLARLRRGVLAAVVTAAALLVLPATRRAARGNAPRRDRRRRSMTPPLDGLRLPPDETEEDRDGRPGAEKDANPIEFAARQPLPGDDAAEDAEDAEDATAAPSPVPSVILISSSDTDVTDDGTGDGGYAVVSHDETFDEAEATRRRSEEARRSTAPDPARFPPLDIFAVTVGDVSRAIEGVRRDEKDAIAFMRAFSDHPDVLHWRIPVADKHRRPWTDHVGRDAGVDARDLAAYHDAVLRFVRARVSFDDAEGRRVAYVEGVLRKYADSV